MRNDGNRFGETCLDVSDENEISKIGFYYR